MTSRKKNEAAAEKAKEEEVEQAVNELFKDNEPATGEIKDIATQQAIDDIQAVIDTMADSAKKDELQANLDKAKELLTEKNEATAEKARQEAAENSIKDLFNDEDVNGTIKETTSQTTIDNAQKAIDAVTDQAKQVELQTQLDKAQAQVDARTAISGNVAAYTEGELYITGTYTGAVTGLSVDVNGKRYYGGDLKDGKVKFYVGDKSLKAGDDIILNLYDASKQIKKSLPVEVIAPLKVAVADYKIGDNYLVATYNNPEIAKVGVIVAGMKYWGGEVKDGNVKFYAIDKIKNPNAEVTMNFYDANNNLLASQPVKVSSTFLEITTANYTIGASNITGTFEGDVKKIAVSINDTKYYGGTLAANGTYKFYALDKKITATDTVIVYGYDANNGLLTQKTVTITE
ncbi:immunoglobulin-like domain-containing protein [Paenilisteria weihenstephanensis]|uniref:immunoglobulin-like domain-containing protein n=1 Tax=Listeria weihenstephanensis TaxID=1006155 RepID=UPI0022773585|nr:immunoglobulin-like domain-containing protein [Listeria weihenstephanensis]